MSLELQAAADKMVNLRSYFQADLDRGIKFNEQATCGFRDSMGAFNACNVLVGFIDDLAFDQEIDVESLKQSIQAELEKPYQKD